MQVKSLVFIQNTALGNFVTIVFYVYFEHVLVAGTMATMKLKLNSFKTKALSECREKTFLK